MAAAAAPSAASPAAADFMAPGMAGDVGSGGLGTRACGAASGAASGAAAPSTAPTPGRAPLLAEGVDPSDAPSATLVDTAASAQIAGADGDRGRDRPTQRGRVGGPTWPATEPARAEASGPASPGEADATEALWHGDEEEPEDDVLDVLEEDESDDAELLVDEESPVSWSAPTCCGTGGDTMAGPATMQALTPALSPSNGRPIAGTWGSQGTHLRRLAASAPSPPPSRSVAAAAAELGCTAAVAQLLRWERRRRRRKQRSIMSTSSTVMD
mmetsp:Transcript_2105/g.5831  ORF Transcript_2105/g.5831 Transcript_2105/m.5831 type:complete len:270 (-) Transcript_2105:530-1339(-)